MAGQTYQVNYIVNVDAQNAQTAINSFKRALSSMNKATKPLVDLQRQVRSLVDTMAMLGGKAYQVKVDTKPATQKLGKLVSALKYVSEEIDRINAKNIRLGNVGQSGTRKQGSQSKTSSSRTSAPAVAPTRNTRTVSSAPPSGYFGSGKSMTYYGKNAPVIPAPTGYTWTQQSALQVPKEFRKAYERVHRQQTVARRIATEGTNSKMNQIYRESTNAVKYARRQVGHYDQLRQNHAYQALTANNEIGRIQQTLDQQKAQTASLIAQRKQLQSLYGSTNNQKLVPQIKAAKAGIASSLAQEQALQSQIASLNQTAQIHTQAAQQATRQQNAAMTRLRRETAINERHEKALARQRRFVTSHMNATAPFTTGWGLTKNAAPPAPPASPGTTTGASRRGSSGSYRSRSSRPATSTYRAPGPTNLGYKLWGPTPLPNNGGMAIDMLKGMGIAYGIAGLGTMVSNIVDQAAEYDNLMKTVENILKSHDDKENFSGRFSSMTQTVRNVGMETKFKVTEVADAAKFLAMAGLDLEAIQQAIRPIADIALVGDTDLGQTADLVTNIMTAYNIAPSKMRNAADIMTNTFTMSNTTLTEIAEAYKYAASLLSAGDVPFQEATAAIGVLGDAGIKGSQAGTTLRTIMANIVNPTKKQQAAWDALGINRYNKDGSRKDILQIFKELNNADLEVDAFYKLFHKTAASGAVALATHVDKWDKIYLENFLSSGMSARLADEKKNTLQGLWAQLTSVFTDKGVTAFNGVQGGLRAWMNSAIGWLKSDRATEVFREVANSLMELMQVLIDASKWFAKFFDWFGPVIKMWAKFQLMIWPVVKAVTALRSVFLGLLGLRKATFFITGITGAFRGLAFAIRGAGTAWMTHFGTSRLGGVLGLNALANRAAHINTAALMGTGSATSGGVAGVPIFGVGNPLLPGLTHKQYIKATKGLNLKRPHASTQGYYLNNVDNVGVPRSELQAWNSGVYAARQAEDKANLRQYRQNRKTFNRRVAKMQALNGAKGFAGMGVGAGLTMAGMSQMTKEDANTADIWSGGLFAAAGMAAMVGGPVGWIAAAGLALGGLAASFASFNANLNTLSGFVNSFTQSHQLLDGALTNGNTRTEKYLEFVWRKNYDINDLIQRRIELMKELLGVETPNETTTKDVGNEVYKTMYDRFYAADSMWGSYGAASRAAELFNNYGEQYGLKIFYDHNKDGWFYKDGNGNVIRYANPDGKSDTNDATMYDVAAAMELLHGQYRSKIIDENQHRLASMLYGKASALDAQNWRDTFAATYGPSSWANKIRPDQWNEDTDVAKHWNGEEIAQSYIGSQLLWSSLYQLVEAQNAIADFKTKLEADTLTELDVVKALRWGDYDILGQTLADYNPNDVSGWYRNMGYYGDGVWRDPSGRETPEVMAQTAAGQMERLLESIQKLGLESDPATQGLQTYANTLLTLAQSFIGQNEAISGSYEGEIRTINGQKWRWNSASQTWQLIDDNNQPAEISQGLIDLSNNMNTLLTTVQTVNSEWPVMFPTTWQNNGSSWWYDYTSPYNWSGFTNGSTQDPFNVNTMLWNPLTNSSTGNNYSWWPNWSQGQSLQTPAMQYNTTGVTMTPQQMGNVVKAPAVTGIGGNNPAGTADGGGGRTGTKTSDYKSSKKERAVPKQININIQNLMKVDSIDLTNPDNVAIIDRMKREVAYALYEAAGDGVMMLNGLATQNG